MINLCIPKVLIPKVSKEVSSFALANELMKKFYVITYMTDTFIDKDISEKRN